MGEVWRKCLKLYPGFPASLESRKAKNQYARLTVQMSFLLILEMHQAAYKQALYNFKIAN